MHNPEIILKAFQLSKEGKNVSQIARDIGAPRSCVRDWIKRTGPAIQSVADKKPESFAVEQIYSNTLLAKYYTHILGVYLGDGHITEFARTYRLRIFQDSRYTKLIQTYITELELLFPNNKVNVLQHGKGKCKVICVYNNDMSKIFPQHGAGRKHNRKIKLEEWQEKIIKQYPQEFLCGLIDSDGCRFIAKQNDKQYVRYQFTNISEDIKDLFCATCEILGIEYWRKIGYKNINIQRNQSVAIIESFYTQKQ